jgi:hypothetical protein
MCGRKGLVEVDMSLHKVGGTGGVCWSCHASRQASDGDLLQEPEVRNKMNPGDRLEAGRRLIAAQRAWAARAWWRDRAGAPTSRLVPPPDVQTRWREAERVERGEAPPSPQ